MSLAESFHRFGFTRLNTPAYFREGIEKRLSQESWIPSETYARLPSWHTHAGDKERDENVPETDLCRQLLERIPEDYLTLTSRLLSDQDTLQDMLFLHDFSISYFDIWDGAEQLDWHCDQISKGEAFLLAYFTERYEWQNEFGGQIEFGRRRLDGDWLNQTGVITGISKINPVHGTVILCNNTNPQFVHRVNPLSPEISRVTLLVGLNTIKKTCYK